MTFDEINDQLKEIDNRLSFALSISHGYGYIRLKLGKDCDYNLYSFTMKMYFFTPLKAFLCKTTWDKWQKLQLLIEEINDLI